MKPENHPDNMQPVETEVTASRRGFLRAAAAGAAALALGDGNKAEAADPRPQLSKPFKMNTVNQPWDHPAQNTLDSILEDPIQYPGRLEIGFVPPPGNKVPTYVPGVAVAYNPVAAMNQSAVFQQLDAATKRAVIDLYAVRHGYAVEHEQYRIAQHNAITGGKAPYPILYEKSYEPNEDGKQVFQGYICKPAGNGETLPYFAFDERTYSMKGKLEGAADDRKLNIELTMKDNGLGFSFFNMDGCTVTYTQKGGKTFTLKADANPGGLDPAMVERATGRPPEKGDTIHISIPAEILREPLKKVGALDRDNKETMFAQAPASHSERLLAALNKPATGRDGPV